MQAGCLFPPRHSGDATPRSERPPRTQAENYFPPVCRLRSGTPGVLLISDYYGLLERE